MDEEKLERIWGSVGFIMHLAQLIEYNLVNIIAGNKFLKSANLQKQMSIKEYEKRAYRSNKLLHNLSNKKTMGDVVSAAKDAGMFNKEIIDKIDVLKNKRDYYAHIFFKEQLFSKDMENNPDKLLNSLSEDVGEFKALNDFLLIIDKYQRNKANMIKNSLE